MDVLDFDNVFRCDHVGIFWGWETFWLLLETLGSIFESSGHPVDSEAKKLNYSISLY